MAHANPKKMAEVEAVLVAKPRLYDAILNCLCAESNGEELAGSVTRELFRSWPKDEREEEIALWRAYIKRHPDSRVCRFVADRLAPSR